MLKEIWKDIPNYEGSYQVSNLGNVKSLNRIVISKKGQRFDVSEKILKPIGRCRDKNYMAVHLCKKGNTWTASVHRLVAEAFIPNPNNLPAINHKDENPLNNHVDNLEWCTIAHNNTYGSKRERVSAAMINHKALSMPVMQYDLDGNYIATYPSTMEARRQIGACHIPEVCSGKRSKCKEYVWKYA